ncbi:unnamed protein product [Phytophthora fragariaefolia]|uniref:Unnamed protein product n=1 Tax=Phytophthora fragariaefolia TaxID=1490495 RepID=A0A9W6Y7V9_9STRA|nr:unnamed protein product [Phytophthora fragariaefolia]
MPSESSAHPTSLASQCRRRQDRVSPQSIPRTPPGEIPLWFEEAFASEGYDSDALELISGLRPHRSTSAPTTEVVGADVESADSPNSECGASQLPREIWVSETWPVEVKRIAEHWNPHHWKFSPVSIGIRNGAGCGCEDRCNAATCANAKENRFCMEANCSFAGCCGNALKEHPSLVLARSCVTGMRGLVTRDDIAAGEVLGEYFGHLDLFGPPCRNGPVNDGFRMHLKTRSTGDKYLGIDAKEKGGILRFMNHACNPCARFHEVQTGAHLTVVAVSVRDVTAGEEVTVSYGDRL